MLSQKNRLFAALLTLTAATCGLMLSACQDVADPDDDASDPAVSEARYGGPDVGDDEDVAVMEDRDQEDILRLEDNDPIAAAAEQNGDPEQVQTLANQCTINGSHPWAVRHWGNTTITLISDMNNSCYQTILQNPSPTTMCAWVKHPVFGNEGMKCATSTMVTSETVLSFGAAMQGWGKVEPGGVFIWAY